MQKRTIAILEKIVDLSLTGFVASLPVSIAFCQTSLAIGWLAWLVKCGCERKWNGFGTRLDMWFLVFLGTSILASAFSINPGASFLALKKFYLVSAVYFIAFNLKTRERIKEIVNLAVWMAALTGVYGFVMFVFGYQQRLLGAQGVAMTSAGIYMMMALVSIYKWPSTSSSRPAWEKFITFLSPIVLMLSLLFTRTVSSLIGFLTGLMVTVKHYYRLAVVVLLVTVSVAVGYSINQYNLSVRLFSGNKITSVYIRLALWRIGWDLIKQKPLTGYGMIDYGDLIRAKKTTEDMHYWGGTIGFGHFHNNFVHITACTGFIGLGAFIELWMAIFIFLSRIFRSSSTEQKPLIKSIIAALAGFMVMGLFEWNFGDSEVVTVVWFLLGLAVAISKLAVRDDRQS